MPQIREKLTSIMSQPRELIFSTTSIFLTRDLVVPYELIPCKQRTQITGALQNLLTEQIELFSSNGEKCMEILDVDVDANDFKDNLLVGFFRVLDRVYE